MFFLYGLACDLPRLGQPSRGPVWDLPRLGQPSRGPVWDLPHLGQPSRGPVWDLPRPGQPSRGPVWNLPRPGQPSRERAKDERSFANVWIRIWKIKRLAMFFAPGRMRRTSELSWHRRKRLADDIFFLPSRMASSRIIMDKTDKNKNPIYAPVTLEFVTVALEYCSFIEKADEGTLFDFVDKATKLLPLLYLKAALLPPLEPDEEAELETTVTEAMYDDLRNRLSGLLGERDVFLDTFHEDMRYSDTPIATAISENLADVFQDIGDFIALFRQGNELVMREALALCGHNFRHYWGERLLNALRALHDIRYDEEESLIENRDE